MWLSRSVDYHSKIQNENFYFSKHALNESKFIYNAIKNAEKKGQDFLKKYIAAQLYFGYNTTKCSHCKHENEEEIIPMNRIQLII